MAHKDLNLSLDHPFIKPEAVAIHDHQKNKHQTSKASPAQVKIAENPAIASNTNTNPTRNQTPAGSELKNAPNTLSVKTRGLLFNLVSIVFFAASISVITWYWITSESKPLTPLTTVAGLNPQPELAEQLETLSQSTQLQLQRLEQQIIELKQQLEKMNTQQESGLLEVNLQNQAIFKAIVDHKVSPAKSSDQWFVNLGSFSDKKAAISLQQQVKQLGYPAEISTVSLQNKTTYRVQIPGFPERERAEIAAKSLMNETNLNGLWVWKNQ